MLYDVPVGLAVCRLLIVAARQEKSALAAEIAEETLHKGLSLCHLGFVLATGGTMLSNLTGFTNSKFNRSAAC